MLEPRAGTNIYGRYLLEKALAKGAMGSVWIAEDTRLKRKVALKTLMANWADSEDAKTRFEREAMAIAKLNSPYIVQVFDYGIDNQCPFIVMELMDGEDLHARLKRQKRLEVREMVPIVVQTAKALTAAHQAGIVHRDLKPGNLFLVQSDEEEMVKVLDFGVAKATQGDEDAERREDDQEATKAGTLLGTPTFMSPEQARSVKEIDHRADLWSLGVIIYRAITGELPFLGATLTDTIVKICTAPIPKASSVNPDLPAEIDTFFARALARDPAARFGSARELAAAFARIEPRPSYPSLSMPGLPPELQRELLESQPGFGAVPPSSQPGLAPSALAGTAHLGQDQPGGIVAAVEGRGPAGAPMDADAVPPSGLFDVTGAAAQDTLGSADRTPLPAADSASTQDDRGRSNQLGAILAAALAVAVVAVAAVVLMPGGKKKQATDDAPDDGSATTADTRAPATVSVVATSTPELPETASVDAAQEGETATASGEPTEESATSEPSAEPSAKAATPRPRRPRRPATPKTKTDDDTYGSRY